MLRTPNIAENLSTLFVSVWPEFLAQDLEGNHWSMPGLLDIMCAVFNADSDLSFGVRSKEVTDIIFGFLRETPDNYLNPASDTSPAPRIASSLIQLAIIKLLFLRQPALLATPLYGRLTRYLLHALQVQPLLRPRAYTPDKSLLGRWHVWHSPIWMWREEGDMRMEEAEAESENDEGNSVPIVIQLSKAGSSNRRNATEHATANYFHSTDSQSSWTSPTPSCDLFDAVSVVREVVSAGLIFFSVS
ncbi:hypothetical protein BDK51DRAFT_51267 [Blyttiomyces helicus]|uniref:Uncharacterized protein n=1 Tax=Blyttiomyces helicus TaxID=388810 RepID=A0A4V1IQM4_9FUNG|nr:hypothetical protein BDK51DRAFT_51267 [Blyttiomyces helicus]|eukprot:RKO87067.1 hypothetical protein BDK51DRAFT_51267 [Blyttiomyces helicus]